MASRGFLLAILVVTVGHAFGGDESWELRGRVLDQESRPVADVSIATYWNANGVTLELHFLNS